MALHNFIRLNGEFDSDFTVVDININYVPVEATLDPPKTVPALESSDMESSDTLAQHLYTRYNS
jgi:hypothetical protein